jgi:hypothetical protein
MGVGVTTLEKLKVGVGRGLVGALVAPKDFKIVKA